MTDTSTEVKRTAKPRDVDYELEVYDTLPEATTRQSPLEDALEKVKANEAAHGKWVLIGRYAVLSAGSAAKNVLTKRHGDTGAVEGWLFQTRRVDKDDKPMQGVFVNYDPNRIVDGAKAEFDAKMERYKAELAAKREARKAGENGATATTNPAESTTPGQANTEGAVPPPPPAGSPQTKTGSDEDKKARAAANKG